MTSPADLARLSAALSHLNPGARQLTVSHGAVRVSDVVRTGLFSSERAASAPGWLRELRGAHVPESLEYGISSFVWRASRPLHPARLMTLIQAGSRGALNTVIRSKGSAWLAVDGGMDEVAIWSQAGRVWQFSQGRPWWVTVPRAEWPRGLAAALGADGKSAARKWDARFGDRANEVVFIGVGMDAGVVRAALDAALVDDSEWAAGPDAWDLWDDPFDFFPYEEDDDEEDDGEDDGGGGAEGDADGDGVGGGGVGGAHGHAHGHVHGDADDDGAHGHAHGEGETCDHEPERPTTCRIVVER